MSNAFGPRQPLFGPYTYRVKQNSNGDTLIAVYVGSKRIAHMDAYWAYSMRSIEGREEEVKQRGRGRSCATDLRALGAEGKYPNVLAVSHAFITDDEHKGKGVGRAMYEAMMVEGFAVRQSRIGGQPGPMFFIPDECSGAGNTSAEARRVWDSLVRDYPSQGTSIRVDAPPVIGSRKRTNPRRRVMLRKNSSDAEIASLIRIVDAVGDEELSGRAGTAFADMLRDEGFEVIGIGGSRIVVGVGDLVAKIDVNAGGPSNQDEVNFYRWNRDHTDRLAPVLGLEADGRILLMPRATLTFDAGVPRKYAKELRAAKAEVLPLAEAEGKVDPDYDFNWGVVNGVVMCIDYGS